MNPVRDYTSMLKEIDIYIGKDKNGLAMIFMTDGNAFEQNVSYL